VTPRLRTAAAGALAAFAGLAAPLPAAAQSAAPPAVSAPSAIVVEASTGDVAYAKDARRSRPIASATKLMTALLVLERARLTDVYRAAAYRPLPVESKIDLRPGERMTVADLLRGLLVESANDAAVTLAEGVAPSRAAFVRDMNRRAAELGLADTRYVDPIGIGAGNRSSARDLAVLTRRLRRLQFFRRTVARPEVVLRSGTAPRALTNRNTLVSLPLVDGVKTGRTLRAGWVLVGSGRRPSGSSGLVQVISVVLAAPSEAARNDDTLALIRWGLRRYKRSTAVRAGATYGAVPIRYRRGAEVAVVAAQDVRRVVRRGRRLERRVVGLPAEVEGPIARGAVLGAVEVYDGRRRVGRTELVAAAAVPAAGVVQRAKEGMTRPMTIVVAVAALAGSVLLARMGFRRKERRPRRTREEPEVA
jgi:D-alanyl-D-alanine carboxypeptidase (penicillin-binding protein 5/6)